MVRTVVLAIGGNAITKPQERGTFEEQMQNIRAAVDPVAGVVAEGHRVVVVHGNGPQVGNLLIKNDLAKEAVPAMPLYVCVSNTQGSLGYALQQQLRAALTRQGLNREVVAYITQVLVDPADPAFQHPTKPVGPFVTEAEAQKIMQATGYKFVEDSGRGWRRVVPSPYPQRIIEGEAIKKALENETVVIAAGGGGIPVIQDASGELHGVDGVIDKDLAAMRLALDTGADVLFLLTGVRRVALNFGRPDQQELDQIPADLARDYLAQGHFPAGSMGPKVAAAIAFLEQGGERVVIGHLAEAAAALRGEAGTAIVS